jgi:hypothetical protein
MASFSDAALLSGRGLNCMDLRYSGVQSLRLLRGHRSLSVAAIRSILRASELR